MATGSTGQRRRITFIETDDSPDDVRKSMPNEKLVEVDLFVRKPDAVGQDEFAVAARLCGCRKVCLAFIDPD